MGHQWLSPPPLNEEGFASMTETDKAREDAWKQVLQRGERPHSRTSG